MMKVKTERDNKKNESDKKISFIIRMSGESNGKINQNFCEQLAFRHKKKLVAQH
jgi:hypothetical protein